MPDFPIVDTHVHLANPGRIDYPGLAAAGPLNRPFSIADFDEARGGVEVEAFVFMEVNATDDHIADEAAWVSELAASDTRLKGIVAGAPLDRGSAARDTLEQLAHYPLVKGVRKLIQGNDVGYCIEPAFIEGVKLLPAFGYSFDACIHHPQLENTIKLVRQCPEVRFILDHIGKPAIKDQGFEPWKAQMKQLASFENVVCKISGVATEADHDNWSREDLKPYIEHVIECFGFDRVIYGGDWFVLSLASTYPRWIETLDWAIEGCSEADKRKLYCENGKAFYRLG